MPAGPIESAICMNTPYFAGISMSCAQADIPPTEMATMTKSALKPFYETHGEKRVAAGHYREVIRYEQHFRPFVEKLIAAVQSPAAHA